MKSQLLSLQVLQLAAVDVYFYRGIYVHQSQQFFIILTVAGISQWTWYLCVL